jgi:hypothetical protein
MTIQFSQAAQQNIEEAGCDPTADLAEIKRCGTTRDEFLQFCLNGADRDRVQGWHDYVDALFADESEPPEYIHTGRYSEEEIARADHENDQAKDDRLTGDR